jgi:hypothetical protein
LAAKTGLIFVWPEIIRGQLTLKIIKKKTPPTKDLEP